MVGRVGSRGFRLPRQPGQPQRWLRRGPAPRNAPDRDGPVPPRGRARPARCPRGVRPVRGPGDRAICQPRQRVTDAVVRRKPASVLILGSGPVVIGQAAEFDYAGTQACRALRAEGVRTILINSNPATIMTDPSVADAIYLEPLTVEAVEAVIAKEKPEGLLAGLGGQTALNLTAAMAEAGVFERHPIRLLGTPLEAIRMAEDREAFRDLLDRLGQPYAASFIVEGATPEARRASADEALVDHRPACDRPAGLHARWDRRRDRRDRGGLSRAHPGRPPRQPDRPGDGRAVSRRLAGDRVRGHARCRGHVHRGLLDGERRSARRPHRRLDRRGTRPDAPGPGPPATPKRGPRDHPRARRRGRLQRPVRPLARLDRLRGDRGQPAGLALVRAGVEGDRLPDRARRGPDRVRPNARGDPERRHRHDRRGVRAGPRLRRRQAAALPVRQVPDGRSDAGQPDEGDRRGDGDRPDVRGGAEQGAPRARAGRGRSAGRGSDLDAELRLPGGRLRGPPGRGGARGRRADPLDRRDRPGLRIDPSRAADRRPDRPPAIPGAVGLTPLAAPRPAPSRRPGDHDPGGDRDRAVVPRRDGPERGSRAGGAGDPRPARGPRG